MLFNLQVKKIKVDNSHKSFKSLEKIEKFEVVFKRPTLQEWDKLVNSLAKDGKKDILSQQEAVTISLDLIESWRGVFSENSTKPTEEEKAHIIGYEFVFGVLLLDAILFEIMEENKEKKQ